MKNRNIIVIGASAGGFEAIKTLFAVLPADLNAAIFIVWHMSPDVRGVMPQVINKHKKMFAAHATDLEPVKNGRVYIAPPDHHLLLEKDRVRVTKGPKENRFRPAIDPLFRSAAYTYGPCVTAVILSGALDDGSAGTWAVKRKGGIAIVQDPADAEVPSMPENAIKAADIDYILPVDQIAPLLMQLVTEPVTEKDDVDMKENENIKREIDIAKEGTPHYRHLPVFGELTPYTCPECHGVLSAIREGGRIRFRCHTGHAFTADSLLSAVTEGIEEAFWSAIRNVQENIMLLNNMGDHFAEINQPKLAATYFKKAKESELRAQLVRKAVTEHEQLSADSIQQEISGEK